MIFAGIVSVADWIGSNSTYFPCAVDDFGLFERIDATEYFKYADRQAQKALTELGWTGWPKAEKKLSFAELFPELSAYPLRGVQRAAIDVADLLTTPSIVVIEAPMGEGKTEAAMYLADRWNVMLDQRGIYFALPTQATSNQMFGRVRRFLGARFSGNILLQLLHGHAALSEEFDSLLKKGAELSKFGSVFVDDHCSDGNCQGGVAAAEWFTYRKRGLLAPFGVGTVDQALLAVLQTRHVFVRLFGLSHKTIIIDEVHAYDAYMSKLLECLLEWLAALGSPVILLSATLPKVRRRALINAYRRGLGCTATGESAELPAECPYPRLSWAAVDKQNEDAIPVSNESTRKLDLLWVDGRTPTSPEAPFALGEHLKTVLAGGGCAAVICNTVNRAQQVYTALKPYFEEGELDLFHARFLFGERSSREKSALARFGKEGSHVQDDDVSIRPSRPHRAVLVATQVIEQSLDIDFDLMVTDLAPIDLLLQRSGRLHRHERPRPAGLDSPVLWICEAESIVDGVPQFDTGTEAVYDAHILLRSWLELCGSESIKIPAEVEYLIEQVYGNCECPVDSSDLLQIQWVKTADEQAKTLIKMEIDAGKVIVPSPNYADDILQVWNKQLEEDEPEIHSSLQALTRLSGPTVSVVFLRAEETARFDPIIQPNVEETRFLLERSVTLSHRGLVSNLLRMNPPAFWRRSPFLRRHRLIELDEKGSWTDGKYRLSLHHELGVTIDRV